MQNRRKTFVREKKIYCGDRYREVDIFLYTANQSYSVKKKRGNRKKESLPKQKNLNDKRAKRYFIQLVNLNFANDRSALHVTLTYKNEYLPSSVAAAEKEAGNFLKRVKYHRKKKGLPKLKYILVTAYTVAKTRKEVEEESKGRALEDIRVGSIDELEDDEKMVRIHHHIIMNGGLDRDFLESLWTKERVVWSRWEKSEDYRYECMANRIGYINADRLQSNESGITALAVYLVKQPNKKKRWSSSRNLLIPTSSTNDNRYSKRKVWKIVRERPSREYWERLYPGWTLTDNDNGVIYEYNDFTGWSIYLKLRKKE